MTREPAVYISTITAFLTAIIGLAVAFGANITDQQQTAILGAVAAAVPIIALLGPVIRQFVTPAKRAQAKVDEAFLMDPAVDTKPTL